MIKEKDNEISFLNSKINDLKDTLDYCRGKFDSYMVSFIVCMLKMINILILLKICMKIMFLIMMTFKN